MRILSIFGTRPEAIKFAPVISELEKHPQIQSLVCVTAQHRQMLDQMLQWFAIKPDVDLDVMQQGQSLTDVTTAVLSSIETVLKQLRPDWVLVHGDTTTTFTAALAAFYQKIPVAHIEAGLRTGLRYAPWPEEMNRTLVGRLANLHFAPTTFAAENLRRENIAADDVVVTGNTVIDAVLQTTQRVAADEAKQVALRQQFSFLDPEKKLILITGHRRENFGIGFQHMCEAMAELATRPDVQLVYPVHLNPNVRKPVQDILACSDNVYLLEPLEYVPFTWLMRQAYLLLTDSGGIQEEAAALDKPVLVMREATERQEGIAAGTVRLVGTDKNTIINVVDELLNDQDVYSRMSQAENPFGDGNAARRIVRALLERNLLTESQPLLSDCQR